MNLIDMTPEEQAAAYAEKWMDVHIHAIQTLERKRSEYVNQYPGYHKYFPDISVVSNEITDAVCNVWWRDHALLAMPGVERETELTMQDVDERISNAVASHASHVHAHHWQ